MSNEKRQTRLLPFRLRRTGVRRADAMSEDFETDAELSALLRAWDAPQQSDGARARLLADFRASTERVPLWRRALTASVRVPLPLAACTAVALVASLVGVVVALNSGERAAQTGARASSAAPVVRVVEVPVVQERVVTRVVYVEKSERDESRSVSVSGLATMRATAPKPGTGSRDAGEPASFFTRVDMGDFRPANEMKIRVIKKGNADEK